MKHVDRIIRYLSGELSDSEKSQFEKELDSDLQLREEYEEVSRAYDLVSGELKKRDEEHFRNSLKKAMTSGENVLNKVTVRRRPRLYLLIPLAASLALLITLYLMNRLEPDPFTRYFQPGSDPVLLALSSETRGIAGSGIQDYQAGNYLVAFQKLDQVTRKDTTNHRALLFLLLAALELDRADTIAGNILEKNMDPASRLDQCLQWYTSLALLKNGRSGEAISVLQPLVSGAGPYSADAQKLLKSLSK